VSTGASYAFEAVFLNDTVKQWAATDGILYLVLDGFDESRLPPKELVGFIADELRTLPLDRLRVRLICRSAVWSPQFTLRLATVWNKELLPVLELAPLRRIDVQTAATAKGPDALALMQCIEARSASRSLHDLNPSICFSTSMNAMGTFPAARMCSGWAVECFALRFSVSGTRISGRTSLPISGCWSPLASQPSLFAGRFGVWDAPDWGDAPAEDVTVDALTGGQEGSGPDSFHVTARDIDETLSTALFRLSRDHEFAWAHRSFEEYLAALYVNEHKMVPQQIFSLLFHPDGHLIPQLAGVGVWMVGSNQAVFDRIAKSDAEVLVRVDISAVPAEAKREVIRSS
jgi:hypothetical protein